MSKQESLQRHDLALIANRCHEETEKFYSRGNSRDEFCLELFRRALVLRNSFAWEAVYQQYAPTLRVWLRLDPTFPQTGEHEDYFVNRALERMWLAVKGEKFDHFPNVASVLQYLKMCLKTSLIDHARMDRLQTIGFDHVGPGSLKSETLPETTVVEKVANAQLWEVVDGHLKSKAERVIIYDSFELCLKPSQICTRHPELFTDVSEVYKIKRNVLKRLERNEVVRSFLG
jgi:hypothetical protein